MDTQEQIRIALDIIEHTYKPQLIQRVQKEEKFILIDYTDIIKNSLELAQMLLDYPEETIKVFEMAIENFDTLGEVKGIKARFNNLPTTQKIMISELRAKQLDKFVYLEGSIRQKSEVRPVAISARFECPSDGSIINILFLDAKFREPQKCHACGRKGKFILLSKDMVDGQGIVLEESTDDLEGGEQPKKINLLLKRDLISPLSERKKGVGTRVRVYGILKEVPIIGKDGVRLAKHDLVIEVNYIESIEEDYSTIVISEEEKQQFINISNKKDLFDMLKTSIVPSIYGYDDIKEALLLQMVGGVRKKRKDNSYSRGDMHIMLIGDAGLGKSQILKRIAKIAPKGRFISGKGVSGAGITACVVKDEFMNGFALEAGALVLANKGILCIDELDKISSEDTDAMHESLEGQTVTISKANIQATLPAETTVLAAANPKMGRFDPYVLVPDQIDMPSTLINRFDLIFPIRDIPEEKKDDDLANFILDLHSNEKFINPPLESKFLRKYFAYAKQNYFPKMTEAAQLKIKEFYKSMRQMSVTKETGETQQKTSISITARQLEGLIRMSEASAKLRLSNKVEADDADRAIRLMRICLLLIGLDPTTGEIDIDRISTGIGASERNISQMVRDMLRKNDTIDPEGMHVDSIFNEIIKIKKIERRQFDEVIEKMMHKYGDLFEPRSRSGKVKLLE
jgi:replicative DNA helicase Mcm